MSNNMNAPPMIRWQLLSTVSALALLSAACGASEVQAADADRPLIWIDLGGDMDNVSGQGEVFAPGFIAANPTSAILQKVTPLQAQKPPTFAFGENASISFQPENSDWVFSVAIRYGRSKNFRHVDHQVSAVHYLRYQNNEPVGNEWEQANFADTHAHRSEQHQILDFTAGKDIGLGIFGNTASSVLNAGVRFAQFTSKSSVDMRAMPDLHIKYYPSAHAPTRYVANYFNTYHATGHASREFRGVGPTLSWTGSAPFAGDQQEGELAIDWGVNAAILFGRQKAHVRHQESAHYRTVFAAAGFVTYHTLYDHPLRGHDINRSITVPNLGGLAGISWRVQDFKVSVGYRVDLFFGAMDTGIDAAKKSNLTFKGPYASISIGLGD
ncbi:MAG TPA: hypothetical protein VGT78_05925 [Rhizomicrobium sp.]|nr:hypothetical protein [Rhizomicrobium sp.]